MFIDLDFRQLSSMVLAVSAVFALVFNILSLRQQRKTVDVDNHLRIREQHIQLWRNLKESSDSGEFRFELYEILNFMEGIADFYVNRRLPKSTENMVSSILEQFLDISKNDHHLAAILFDPQNRPSTYENIFKFARKKKLDLHI